MKRRDDSNPRARIRDAGVRLPRKSGDGPVVAGIVRSLAACLRLVLQVARDPPASATVGRHCEGQDVAPHLDVVQDDQHPSVGEHGAGQSRVRVRQWQVVRVRPVPPGVAGGVGHDATGPLRS